MKMVVVRPPRSFSHKNSQLSKSSAVLADRHSVRCNCAAKSMPRSCREIAREIEIPDRAPSPEVGSVPALFDGVVECAFIEVMGALQVNVRLVGIERIECVTSEYRQSGIDRSARRTQSTCYTTAGNRIYCQRGIADGKPRGASNRSTKPLADGREYAGPPRMSAAGHPRQRG